MIRPALPEDIKYIVKTCVQLAYPLQGREMHKPAFNRSFREVVLNLVSEESTKIDVLTDEHNTILSFIVYSPSSILFAYTREPFRKKGYAKKLLNHAFPVLPKEIYVPFFPRFRLNLETKIIPSIAYALLTVRKFTATQHPAED